MEIEIKDFNGSPIAEIISEDIVISNAQDTLDLMADCGYQGADKIIIHEKNIVKDFFDLKTKLAGDILQKFSNYKVQLAIVGDFTKFNSKSLKDFIFESNKTGRVFFVESVDEAKDKLGRH